MVAEFGVLQSQVNEVRVKRTVICVTDSAVCGGTAAAAPPPFRPSEPALFGSRPLVTPYYCRLGDLLFCVCIIVYVYLYLVVFVVFFSFVASPSVLWYCWLGLLTCKIRLPYNLYCVGGDVKHCSLTHSAVCACVCSMCSRWMKRSMSWCLKFHRRQVVRQALRTTALESLCWRCLTHKHIA